jgi:uroporphyrinogen III methyltransferase/synthase
MNKKEELINLLQDNKIDAVTFTSSSTVSNFISLLDSKNTGKLLKNIIIASIGPITSKTARSLDIEPEIEAGEYTIQGLVDSLLAYYESKNP